MTDSNPAAESDVDMLPEYDLKSMKVLSRGKYAGAKLRVVRVVHVDADLMKSFPDDAAVNAALR